MDPIPSGLITIVISHYNGRDIDDARGYTNVTLLVVLFRASVSLSPFRALLMARSTERLVWRLGRWLASFTVRLFPCPVPAALGLQHLPFRLPRRPASHGDAAVEPSSPPP